LHTGVRTATARQELSELVRIVLPLARSLARQRGVATPDLSPIETAVEHRDHELGAVTDAFAELRLATVGESDADVTPLAGAMCAALLHQGRGDAGAGLAALEAVAEHQASDAELTALRERLAEQAQADAVARADERASAGDGAATDPRAAANSYLSAAVKSFASTASSLLEEPRVIEAWLPPSWFDGHDDPLQDHALFLRHIPEVRARADWEVPRINVRTDSELEPDRYRIVKGDATELGRAAPGHRYGTREAFALLGLEAELAPEAWGLRRLPEGVVSAAGDLGGLVTMDELEVVASRMSNIARPGTDGDRRRWPRRVAAALSRAVLAKSGSPAST
jgi:hypothetical protein